jgi:hypothetical protein
MREIGEVAVWRGGEMGKRERNNDLKRAKNACNRTQMVRSIAYVLSVCV